MGRLPKETISYEEIKDDLDALALSEDERMIVELSFRDHVSLAEIGRQLGVSREWVRHKQKKILFAVKSLHQKTIR